MMRSHNDKTQIELIVTKYIEGINDSNADALVRLFTTDGVVMAPEAPTMAGTAQLNAFFSQAFSAVKLSAQIYFDDIVVSDDNAYARTHSKVKMTALQANISQDEENRELFLFQKEAGEWKIARYMFNKISITK